MSDKRSRRRFLADLLFLGGGLTAASLVAGAVLQDSSPTVDYSELTSAETSDTALAPESRKATPGFDANDDGILNCEPKQIDEPLMLRAREKTYKAKPPDYAYGGMTLPSIK